jgi:hypothetical protein
LFFQGFFNGTAIPNISRKRFLSPFFARFLLTSFFCLLLWAL